MVLYDEVEVDKLPNLELVNLKFLVSLKKEGAKEKLMQEIIDNSNQFILSF